MATGFFLEQAVEVLEKGMIERALQATESNQSEAAKCWASTATLCSARCVQYRIDGKHPRRKPAAIAQAPDRNRPVRRRRAALRSLWRF